MLEMRVTGLGLDAASKTPVVYLRQVDGEARLSILVGAMEALSISLMLNGEQLPRPLTHDLLLMCLKAMGARLGGVEICDMRDGLYLAALNLRLADKAIRLDCRPSDAVALALRAQAPIFVRSSLLTQGREDAAQTGAAATTPRESAQRPDAASDMARQAEARRKADVLNGMLLRGRDLPHADPDVERRYRELLRVLEPVTSQKM
ncbi:bifunctional nuclease family protein [uncultured Desulfovibrio sp.]|uniref:bifunctional nuclease family protein n=1 Tax=uncultured Desulfovibrio sp. TaxID=167968 RepID=UPI00261C6D55|nr:bifunctional nuclease family protein [uncultured Desulfovibrio sp.]